MLSNRKIRVIKRDQQRQRQEERPAPAPDAGGGPPRSVKTVVSGWVREHQQRAEEFRNTYATLLKEVGFTAPRDCVRC